MQPSRWPTTRSSGLLLSVRGLEKKEAGRCKSYEESTPSLEGRNPTTRRLGRALCPAPRGREGRRAHSLLSSASLKDCVVLVVVPCQSGRKSSNPCFYRGGREKSAPAWGSIGAEKAMGMIYRGDATSPPLVNVCAKDIGFFLLLSSIPGRANLARNVPSLMNADSG